MDFQGNGKQGDFGKRWKPDRRCSQAYSAGRIISSGTMKSLSQRKELDKNAKQPGYCHYPNIDQHNEATRIKKTGGSPISIRQGSITDPQEEDTLEQLELFPQLAA